MGESGGSDEAHESSEGNLGARCGLTAPQGLPRADGICERGRSSRRAAVIPELFCLSGSNLEALWCLPAPCLPWGHRSGTSLCTPNSAGVRAEWGTFMRPQVMDVPACPPP